MANVSERLVPELARQPEVTSRAAPGPAPRPASPLKMELNDPPEQTSKQLNGWQRACLLFTLCYTQFLSVAMIFAMFLATPVISQSTGLAPQEVLWVVGSYAICYTSFVLLGGKVVCIFDPVRLFSIPYTLTCFIALGTSFWSGGEKFGFLLCNGLAGVGGALMTPSAVRIIIALYPADKQQKRALTLFNLSSPLGQSLGGLLAGVILFASWRWIYRIVAISMALQAPGLYWCLSRVGKVERIEGMAGRWWRMLDVVGGGFLVSTIFLLVAGLFNGNSVGWDSREFIIPFVSSFFCLLGFILWERTRKSEEAIIPGEALKAPNFWPLCGMLLGPLGWWGAPAAPLSTWYQLILHRSPFQTGLHLFPLGVVACILATLMSTVCLFILHRPRLVVPLGILVGIGGLLLIIFSQGRIYWRLACPGYILYSAGITFAFIPSSVALIQSCSPTLAGFSGSLAAFVPQLGAIVGASIQVAISQATGPLEDWKSTQASLWFVLAWMAVSGLAFALSFDHVQGEQACRSAEAPHVPPSPSSQEV